jgi:phenylacetaldehyde dehydrogenase
MAGWTTKLEGQTLDSSITMPPGSRYLTYTLREAVGVVGAIIPWNFPLLEAIWKIAPSLAAGCTIVLKPAEETPLTALRLAALCQQAGIPDGVVNIVTGRGVTAGAALLKHPDIDKLTFTGSTQVGRLVGHAAVAGLKNFTLELGGKSPMILFADMEEGKEQLIARLGMFFNQGQVCTAGTRVLIEQRVFDKTLAALSSVADSLRLGPGLDVNAEINPVVSLRHRDRVQGFIDRAVSAGAHLASGQHKVPDVGYYLAPSILYGMPTDSEAVQEEIFGPVITAIPFKDEADALALANDTAYGLSASVWTTDLNKAMRLTRGIKAGTVWVNSHNVLDPNLPFGGMKQSGIGREHGRPGVDSYLETKTVMIAYGQT